jgi:hypothetical protein
MTCSKTLGSLTFAVAFSCLAVSPAHAQRHGGGGGGGAVARGGGGFRGGGVIHGGGGVAIGRPFGVAPRVISPRIIGYGVYRPYFYYRPGISIGFYGGFGYPYYYPYGYAYPYPYSYYPYSYGYPYPYYGYGYSYPGYSYPPSYGYPQQGTQQPYPQQPTQGSVTTQQPAAYGGVRIEGASREAQVYVDGYYAGLVEDFQGDNKHLNLTAGSHQVEIRIAGEQPVAFDVNVPPNQTITVRVP